MNRGRRRKFGMSLLGLLILACSRSSSAEVFVSCERVAPKTYKIEGVFQVYSSSHVAWDVLTDYDHISSFVPDMLSSKVKERRAGGILLDQVAQARFLLFSRPFHVLLGVQEQPPGQIVFHDTLLKDFLTYEGSWTIEKNSVPLKVIYNLKVTPASDAPRLFAKTALKHSARNLLNRIRLEIIRRNGDRGGSTVN